MIKNFFQVLLFFLIFSNSNADLYALKIDLINSEYKNKKFILKNGYVSKCRMNDIKFDQSSVMHFNLNYFTKEKEIISEFYIEAKDEKEQMSLSLNYSTSIKNNGSLGNTKIINKKINDKIVNSFDDPFVDTVASLMEPMLFDKTGYSPGYGKPIKNISFDGKNKLKSLFNKMPVSSKEEEKSFKEFTSHLFQNTKFPITKKYLGDTVINGERYVLIEYKFKINYSGNIPDIKNFMKDYNAEQIAFFHAESGLPSIVYNIVSNANNEMYKNMTCSIYQNDKLISEISTPMLKDKNLINKIPKNIVIDNQDFVVQLKKLDELYKSGAITKEEFEKAKAKILK